MFRQFGLFGVEPTRQMATVNWFSARFCKFGQLLARYQAGKLRRYEIKRVVRPGRKLINTPSVRMPRKFAWLVLTARHHAACYGVQLQHVLSAPEMTELLEISVQARRILRPLLRALAVELPWTVDKPPAERAMTRKRKPRPKPEPYKIPLPRGAITWARREKALDNAIMAKNALVLEMAKARAR